MTISSHHYRAIISRKQGQAKENRQMILSAVKELGSCRPSEIRRYLHEKISQQVKEQYERSGISFSRKKMESEVENKTPNVRTIHRWLVELKKEKLIEHNNSKYSITDKAKSEIRYWAKEFGSFALSQLMYSYFPRISNLEENIDKLVEIFGFYTIYCFVEAARPAKDDSVASNSITSSNRNDLSLSWTNEVFDHEEMFHSFLGIINSLYDDDKVEKIWSEIKIDKDRGGFIDKSGRQFIPNVAKRLIDDWKMSLVDTLHIRSKSNNTDYRSPFELEEDTIEKITHMLKKNYPKYYNNIFHTRDFLFKKREGALPSQKDIADHLG
jgi:DNA-binding PadR family transcriptional regulator